MNNTSTLGWTARPGSVDRYKQENIHHWRVKSASTVRARILYSFVYWWFSLSPSLSPPSVQGVCAASVVLWVCVEAGGGGGTGRSGQDGRPELGSGLGQARAEQTAAAGTTARFTSPSLCQRCCLAQRLLGRRPVVHHISLFICVCFQMEGELSDSQSQLQALRSEVSSLQREVKTLNLECSQLRWVWFPWCLYLNP